jgi:hypothetical protein
MRSASLAVLAVLSVISSSFDSQDLTKTRTPSSKER